MIAEYTIEGATESDVDAITALEAEAFPSPWKREFFTTELDAPRRYARVAKTADGALIGYLFAMYVLDELHVNKIAVAASYRRAGIAMALMDDCVRFAKSIDVTTISLEVRESNTPAQQFYRKLHFTALARRGSYYPDGEAAIIMTARLSS